MVPPQGPAAASPCLLCLACPLPCHQGGDSRPTSPRNSYFPRGPSSSAWAANWRWSAEVQKLLRADGQLWEWRERAAMRAARGPGGGGAPLQPSGDALRAAAAVRPAPQHSKGNIQTGASHPSDDPDLKRGQAPQPGLGCVQSPGRDGSPAATPRSLATQPLLQSSGSPPAKAVPMPLRRVGRLQPAGQAQLTAYFVTSFSGMQPGPFTYTVELSGGGGTFPSLRPWHGLGCHNQGLLVASRRGRPGRLLSLLRCPGWSPQPRSIR